MTMNCITCGEKVHDAEKKTGFFAGEYHESGLRPGVHEWIPGGIVCTACKERAWQQLQDLLNEHKP